MTGEKPIRPDAMGTAARDFFENGINAVTVLERLPDGYTEEMPISIYFESFDEWPEYDRATIQWAKGRVLDVGVGAGRVALWLQEQGHDVVGIDLSGHCLDICRKRGVKDVRFHNILEGPLENEKFDTVVLLGHNLGIAGRHDNVGPYLRMLASMLNPGGHILLTQVNWEKTRKPEHLELQEANRVAGRHPVEFALNIKYGDVAEKFDWCLTNQDELRDIAGEIGLDVVAIIDAGQLYGAVLKVPEAL